MTSRSGSPVVVVDTGVFGAGLTARSTGLAERYRPLLAARQLIITVQTVTELYFGAKKDAWGEARLQQLDRRLAIAVIALCDDHLARTCADLRLACLRAGHPLAHKIHANDLWIGATAVRYAIPLVTDDRVFVNVPGLDVLMPEDG